MAIKYAESFTFLEVPEAEARVHEAFGVAAEDLAALFLLPAAKVRLAWCFEGVGLCFVFVF